MINRAGLAIARGEELDEIGNAINVPRIGAETDHSYRKRIQFRDAIANELDAVAIYLRNKKVQGVAKLLQQFDETLARPVLTPDDYRRHAVTVLSELDAIDRGAT